MNFYRYRSTREVLKNRKNLKKERKRKKGDERSGLVKEISIQGMNK
jgi:hypothetical protein